MPEAIEIKSRNLVIGIEHRDNGRAQFDLYQGMSKAVQMDIKIFISLP